MMTSIGINELFDINRFPAVSLPLVTIVIYFPVGLVLAVLRIFIGIHAYLVAWLLPKSSVIRRYVLRVMCSVLGLFVIVKHRNNRQTNCRVLVANYTSPVDRLAVEILFPSFMPSVWDLPPSLTWLLGYEEMGAKHGREMLIQNAKKHCREVSYPLLAFPEGATTNGKVGLLKFSVWPFSLDEPIQPIIIQIKRPAFTTLAVSVAGSSWWSDLFWFLFVPYSCFCISVLPVEVQSNDETVQQFSVRIQQLMAASLNVAPTLYTSADKVEFLKQRHRCQHDEASSKCPVSAAVTTSNTSSEMDVMVRQVQTVLPNIPSHAIRQDLYLTHDVDLTINNVLEGRVVYTAEQTTNKLTPGGATHSSPGGATHSSGPAGANTVTFGRTPTERHLTFAERKKVLLDSARQRYLEKQGQ